MYSIIVSDIHKRYKKYSSKVQQFIEWISPSKNIRHSNVNVLNGISFKVGKGEAVGIIGMNGAGKSTLLKIITGTTSPSEGNITINGRVAALLELGMGFHLDFTGRENAIMSGQLLGLSLAQVTALMPEIESFAEIGDYIDQPVKTYSSGMQMRLGFSVATVIRPDILIVDEALSVGDAYFQHKSFDRIRKFRESGTTLLLVSHDKSAIQSICDRAILLNAGKVEMEGNPEVVMDYYNAMLADRADNSSVVQELNKHGQLQTISGNGDATISEISLSNEKNELTDTLRVGENVTLNIKVNVKKHIDELVLGYMIKDRLGQPVFGTNTYHLKERLHDIKSGTNIEFNFKFNVGVGEGNYSIAVALHDRDTHINKNYEWRDLALVFSVINVDKTPFIGVSWLPPEMEYRYER